MRLEISVLYVLRINDLSISITLLVVYLYPAVRTTNPTIYWMFEGNLLEERFDFQNVPYIYLLNGHP